MPWKQKEREPWKACKERWRVRRMGHRGVPLLMDLHLLSLWPTVRVCDWLEMRRMAFMSPEERALGKSTLHTPGSISTCSIASGEHEDFNEGFPSFIIIMQFSISIFSTIRFNAFNMKALFHLLKAAPCAVSFHVAIQRAVAQSSVDNRNTPECWRESAI